jgi:hypothetical protein
MLYYNNNHNNSLLRPVGVRGRYGGRGGGVLACRGGGVGGRRRGGVRGGCSGGHFHQLFPVAFFSLIDLLSLLLRVRFAVC